VQKSSTEKKKGKEKKGRERGEASAAPLLPTDLCSPCVHVVRVSHIQKGGGGGYAVQKRERERRIDPLALLPFLRFVCDPRTTCSRTEEGEERKGEEKKGRKERGRRVVS